MAHSTWELNYITGDPEDETLSSSNQNKDTFHKLHEESLQKGGRHSVKSQKDQLLRRWDEIDEITREKGRDIARSKEMIAKQLMN